MRAITPERLFWVAAAAAAVSVGLAAEPLARRLAGGGLPPAVAVPAQRQPEPPVSLDALLALAPFGRVPPADGDDPEPAGEAAPGLTLRGVVIAARPEASRAIVSSPDEPPQAYRVGQTVPGGARLAAVERDRVTLDRDGRRAILRFAELSPAAPDAVEPGAPPPAPIPAVAAPPPSETAAIIADYRDRFRDNPYRVLEDLGLSATEAGYLIGPAPAEAVRRAGLRPGDVVDTVNGQPVGTVELDRRFFDAVAATGQARVELVRDGRRVVMSFPLR